MATGINNSASLQGSAVGNLSVAEHQHAISDIQTLEDKLTILDSIKPLLETCNRLLNNQDSSTQLANLEQQILEIKAIIDIDESTNPPSRLEEILTRLKALEDGTKNFLGAYSNYIGAITDTEKKFVEQGQEISEIKTNISRLETIVNSSSASILGENLSALAELVEQLQATVDDLSGSKLESLSGTMDTLAARVEGAIASDTEKISLHEDRITLAEGVIKKMRTEVSQIKVLDNDFTTRVDKLEKDLSTSQEKESEMATKLDPLVDVVNTLTAALPTGLEITKMTEQNKELDYKFSVMGDAPTEQDPEAKKELYYAELPLTGLLNDFVGNKISVVENSITSVDARLCSLITAVGSLETLVAALSSHHNFKINYLHMYQTDLEEIEGTENSIRLLSTNTVAMPTAFTNAAILDNHTKSPADLRGKAFYIIFEVSYPIRLDKYYPAGVEDTEGTLLEQVAPTKLTIKTTSGDTTYDAPGTISCTRLGMPNIQKAVYVIHPTAEAIEIDNENYLAPFVIPADLDDTDSIILPFGTMFTEIGEYSFGLTVTDPHNENTTATEDLTMKVNEYCFYGTYAEGTLPTESVANSSTENAAENGEESGERIFDITTKFTKLADTELTAPSCTIDWTEYNNKNSTPGGLYYYYAVPTYLLSGANEETPLTFITGFGPGGWDYAGSTVLHTDTEANTQCWYSIFRTSNQLTYCPPTRIILVSSKTTSTT